MKASKLICNLFHDLVTRNLEWYTVPGTIGAQTVARDSVFRKWHTQFYQSQLRCFYFFIIIIFFFFGLIFIYLIINEKSKLFMFPCVLNFLFAFFMSFVSFFEVIFHILFKNSIKEIKHIIHNFKNSSKV